MFKKKGKRAVFFERNYRSQHLQVQVVPVSAEAALHLMEAFMVGCYLGFSKNLYIFCIFDAAFFLEFRS